MVKKKRFGKIMVDLLLSYRNEVWTLNATIQNRINTIKIYYLRRRAGISELQRITTEKVKRRMETKETIVTRVEARGLRWFEHVMRMDDEWGSKQIFNWQSPEKRKRGRPRKSWNDGMKETIARGLRQMMP